MLCVFFPRTHTHVTPHTKHARPVYPQPDTYPPTWARSNQPGLFHRYQAPRKRSVCVIEAREDMEGGVGIALHCMKKDGMARRRVRAVIVCYGSLSVCHIHTCHNCTIRIWELTHAPYRGVL
jgi:hypothetical protein